MKLRKEEIIEYAKKFIEDKKIIREYLRGTKSKKDLDDRGIKLVTPI